MHNEVTISVMTYPFPNLPFLPDPDVLEGCQREWVQQLQQCASAKSKAGLHDEWRDVLATQSAPVLVINGKVNPNFPTGKLIKRNGVGIKKDGTIFFALETMNFNDFAEHFIKNGCVKALYLDGFVSQVWHKGEPVGTSGPFGPIIGAMDK